MSTKHTVMVAKLSALKTATYMCTNIEHIRASLDTKQSKEMCKKCCTGMYVRIENANRTIAIHEDKHPMV